VVTVCVVGGAVVVDVVLETAGFHMLKRQYDGLVIAADSGPVFQNRIRYEQIQPLSTYLSHTTKYSAT
jgi:hypothetical protein